MKKMIAIHASPRKMWNTGTLVREAAKGAQLEGAQVNVIDLYRLDSFSERKRSKNGCTGDADLQ